MNAKEELLEILEFYKFKIKNNGCTMEEINSAAKMLEENLNISGTIRDFAEFYDVPESVIRTNISRKLIDKPKRKVMYPFHKFIKIAPEKWKNKLHKG